MPHSGPRQRPAAAHFISASPVTAFAGLSMFSCDLQQIRLILDTLFGSFEIPEIRCLLPLSGRHQIAVTADVIVLVADDDMIIALDAVVSDQITVGRRR